MIELGNILYVFQVSLAWFKSVTNALNTMYGDTGVTVSRESGTIRICLGGTHYNYRTISCCQPTFTDGKLTGLTFYNVRAFCEFTESVQTETVAVEECTCGEPAP